MDQLMQKLMLSKAIMDKTDGIKRSDSRDMNSPSNMVESFNIPQAKYNIPQEFLQEQQPSSQMSQPYLSSLPVENTKPVGVPTIDAIKNSRLPDEIKKLMMEHPISQPQQQQTATLSNDLIERASRLMKENPGGYVPESAKSKQPTQAAPSVQQSSNIDYKLIQKMINEAVNNALKENGLVAESSEKTNELFSFKVGKHIFEGKVTKIKKLS
jgi:hypothetical protein